MPESPPKDQTTEARLDILRGRVAIELSAVSGLTAIADICLQHRFDELLVSTMMSARERMSASLMALKLLEQERTSVAATRAAAQEFQRERK